MLEKIFRKLNLKQDGSVVVIVALFMTVLIGISALVLDMGLAYNKKAELQKDMDSVALAAVRELPADNTSKNEWKNAKAAAIKYAQYNGISDLVESDILPVYEGNNSSNRIIGIKVKDEVIVNYNFAKILGINSSVVNCDSTAVLQPAEGVSGLLPLAFPKVVVDYLTGDKKLDDGSTVPNSITLKLGPHKDDIDADDVRKILEQEFINLYTLAKSKDGKIDSSDVDKADSTDGWRGAVNFVDADGKTIKGGKYKDSMENGGVISMVSIGDVVELKPGTVTVHDKDDKLYIDGIYPVPLIEYKGGKLVVVGFATVKITGFEFDEKDKKEQNIKLVVTNFLSEDLVASGVSKGGMVENYYGVMAAKLVD